MSETSGAPLPPPAAVPKKTSPVVIIIVVIVVILCICFGVLGLLFGFSDPILQMLGFN